MSGNIIDLQKAAEGKAAEGKAADKPVGAKNAETAETKSKRELLEWADDIASKAIAAALADAALRFLDDVDDEELGSLDLKGEFDPIVDERTGGRLSDAIEEFAEKIQGPEKTLRRIYTNALKKKWKNEKQAIPIDPTGSRYGKNYMVNRHGVWTKLNARGLDDLYVWRRILRTRIDPLALSRDTSRQRNWRHRYLITDETGAFEVEIGKEKLAKEANSAISTLMRHGVHVVETREARQHLATFLRYKPLARVLRAPRVGWFEARKGCWVFVLPTETLGNAAKINILLDAAPGQHGFHRSGTAQEWRDRIAAPLAANSNVILAVGTFLAAPLLRWADEPGGGFHFYGGSKILKTLLLAIGTSVWGKPYIVGAGPDAFGFSWDTTAARLGERAVLRSDVGLGLDEISAGDPKAIANAAYKLAGGVDRGRFGQAERDFNILFLSTGEVSFAEFLPNARPGQLVRCADIPAAVKSGTAFETVTESEVDAVARWFYAAAKEYHGAVGYDWLKRLVALEPKQIKPELNRLREMWRALPEVAAVVHRAHPQVMSVISRFGLVNAALHMASTEGIVPWTAADIDAAIIACMQRWLNQRGNLDTAGELLREIRRRRQMFAATINDRFIHLTLKGRRLVPASAADQSKINAEKQFDGYVKAGRILVRPEAWRRLWIGLDAEAVNKHLLRAGLLIPGPNGEVPSLDKFKSNAAGARFYVLAPAFTEAP